MELMDTRSRHFLSRRFTLLCWPLLLRPLQELSAEKPANWFGGLVVGQFRTDEDEQYLVRTSMIKLIEDVMINSLKEIVVGIYLNK